MNSKELKNIRIGSADIYVTKWTGTVPENSEIEKDENMIGRTKNGATFNYSAEWVTAESDDGKARRSKLKSETASLNYGNITPNSETIEVLVATARRGEIENGTRRTKLGGITNDKGEKYLIRAVHRDSVCGDLRITGVGVNKGGWEQAFNDSEQVINSTFEFEPLLDDEGTLAYYDEDAMNPDSMKVTLAAGSSTGKTKVLSVNPVALSGNNLKYKIGDSAEDVYYDQTCTTGWTALTVGTTEISATAGKIITVVEVDSSNKAKRCGTAVVIDNLG